MIRPTMLNQGHCYFPLGNTLPASLTADLPPEQDAEILLLGCGDVRNVLFTCFADAARKIDVTCCDIEPLIHARNVLLYTLLMEDKANVNIERIWNIYYHWKLDKKSMELLENQTQKLLQVSESIDEWHGSVYGSTIRFCDARSLSCVRSYWMGYRLEGLSHSEKARRIDKLQAAVKRVTDWRGNHYDRGSMSTSGLRGTSPIGFKAGEDLFEVANQWRNCGIMPSSRTALNSTILNPAFLYSPDRAVTLNSTLEPLYSIPACTAYTPIMKGSAFHHPRNGASSAEHVVDSAKIHFKEWASAFRKAVANKSVIRVFSGDALAFCFTLHHLQLTNRRSMNLSCDSLTTSLLELSQEDYGNGKNAAPLCFDIVDTSNLADPLGPLNLIPIASTLLKYNTYSTLYTEILIQRDSDLISRLNNFFGVDVHSMSLLLGLAMPELFTNATDNFEEDPVYNAVLEAPKGADDFARSRFRWRRWQGCQGPSNFPYIHVEAKALAKILVEVHYTMYRYEDTEKTFNMSWNPFMMPSHGDMARQCLTLYNRASFASLLKFLKGNIITNWDQCIKDIYNKILSVNSVKSMTFKFMEELFLYMHLFGVDSSQLQKPTPSDVSDAILASKLPTKEDVPEQLCVTIRVPREKLKAFNRRVGYQMGNPALACSILGKDSDGVVWEHTFSSVQIAFGTWHEQTKEDDSYPYIDEDSSQLSGTSDMFVSIMIPTKILLKSKRSVPRVRCELLKTARTTELYAEELSFPLLCFASYKMTSKNVFVTRYMPGMSALPAYGLVFVRQDEPLPATVTVQLEDSGSKRNTLIQRATLECQTAKNKLAIPSSKVEIKFKSPLLAFVTIAQSETLEFKFPFPVSPSKYRVRIARKSSYIEVASPLFNPLAEDAASFLFPSFVTETPSSAIVPALWTSSRIDLDAMPPVDLKEKHALVWIIGHASLMFSTRERCIRETNMRNPEAQVDSRTDIKDSIFSILMHYTGLRCQQAEVFALSKMDGSIQTLIFPSCLRLDLVNHTIVLDTAIIPLTKTVSSDPKVARLIQKLTDYGLCKVKVSEDENHAWKAMMPALVERCRTAATWKHAPGCEYIQAGVAPLPGALSEDGISPICSCGVGKFPSEGFLQSLMKKLPNLRYVINRYATRAVIAPIFAVPYVEDCSIKDLSDKMDTVGVQTPDELRSMIEAFALRRGVHNKKKCTLKEKCVACARKENESVEAAEQQLFLCSRCKLVRYCSTKCQKADWKIHKRFCVPNEF